MLLLNLHAHKSFAALLLLLLSYGCMLYSYGLPFNVELPLLPLALFFFKVFFPSVCVFFLLSRLCSTLDVYPVVCFSFFVFFVVVFILRRMGKIVSQAHRIGNPALAGVSFSSIDGDSASCPFRRSPLLLRRRKPPLYPDV